MKTGTKRISGILLSLALMLGLMFVMGQAAYAYTTYSDYGVKSSSELFGIFDGQRWQFRRSAKKVDPHCCV